MTAPRLSLPLALVACLCVASARVDAARPGEPAPGFSLVDTHGAARTLAEFSGKYVVLEWHNFGCNYVKKHYAGNMQRLQKEFTAKGVVWLTVISSAPGQQGYFKPEEANGYVKDRGAAPTAVLLDGNGEVARLFEVKTTPQVFLVSPEGQVIYTGAVDSKPTIDADDIPTATNYLAAALADALAGRPVTTPMTRPYGCSIKFAPGAAF